MPKRMNNNNMLQRVGGWCGILGGGAMVVVLAYLGTVLSQSNAGLDLIKRIEYIAGHRGEYRFCWAAAIVISTALFPFLFALYDGLKGKARALAVLGFVTGSLGLLFTALVGAIRASSVASIASYYMGVSGPMSIKRTLILDFLFSEKLAFNVDNYMGGGLFVLAAIFIGAALCSMAKYPKIIPTGLCLGAILGVVGIAEELFFHCESFHIREYDYNVFISASVILISILVVVMGARLASGKNP